MKSDLTRRIDDIANVESFSGLVDYCRALEALRSSEPFNEVIGYHGLDPLKAVASLAVGGAQNLTDSPVFERTSDRISYGCLEAESRFIASLTQPPHASGSVQVVIYQSSGTPVFAQKGILEKTAINLVPVTSTQQDRSVTYPPGWIFDLITQFDFSEGRPMLNRLRFRRLREQVHVDEDGWVVSDVDVIHSVVPIRPSWFMFSDVDRLRFSNEPSQPDVSYSGTPSVHWIMQKARKKVQTC